jgi:hypothetical protein
LREAAGWAVGMRVPRIRHLVRHSRLTCCRTHLPTRPAGGYVFIINVIPIYVVVLVASGRYSPRLYVAYSTFYVLGSLMAMQVPFVGFNVIRQAESAASHGVFLMIQVRRRRRRQRGV